ncbi:hypothetical protein OAN12_03530 [Halioglobus sp.]|nr:hypothetical protein [Halioglobus sp.]
MSLRSNLKWQVKSRYHSLLVKDKVKYFCIGRNKTGTTSLKKAFEDLGFIVGDQRAAELLTDRHYFAGDFEEIIKYCKTAQVFQDVPFSYPDTFKHLDVAYPGSKFILSVRDDAEQWYRSLTAFHSRLFGNGQIPTVEDLHNAAYVRPGFIYNTVLLHGTTDEDPYNKEKMIAHYDNYNRSVIEYFSDRPNDLLILNVADEIAHQRFADYLGIASMSSGFPWENQARASK